MLILCGMAACVSIFATPEEPLTADGKERATYKTDPNFAIRSNCRKFETGASENQIFQCATAAWDRAHYTALVVASKMSSSREIRKECFGFDLPRDAKLTAAAQAVFIATPKCLSALDHTIDGDSLHERAGEMREMVRLAKGDIMDGLSNMPQDLLRP